MKYLTVNINGKKIKAKVADSLFRKTMGLMFRRRLPKDEGMLFVFDREVPPLWSTIWMAGMLFSIDIIWVDSKRRVVHVVENAKPPFDVHVPRRKSMYVLEVNAGFVKKNGIKIGTMMKF